MAAAKTYRSTGTRTSSSTTATYNTVSIGTAADDRYVIIGTSGEAGAGGDEAFTATCNGDAMTLLADGFDATAGQCAAFFLLLVPTGTTCDIVVTSAGTHLNNVTHVWTATGIDPTLYASAENADDPVNINANVPLGGVAFGCAQFSSTTAITTTGFTEDYDTSVDGDRFVAGSYGPAGSAETPRTFTFDGGAGDAFGLVVVFEEATTTAYTLTAAAGSYVLTGNAAGLKRGLMLTAAAGSYAVTGVAAGQRRTYALAAAVGAYTLTGVAAGLARGLRLSGAAGAYVLTGNAAAMRRGAKLVAAAGTYTLTGGDVAFLRTYALAAQAGAYILTGNDAGLVATHTDLLAGTGVYVLTGNDAALRRGFSLAAGVGSYALTGVAAGGVRTYALQGAVGSYVLTGIDVTFRRALQLTAAAGSYTLTGNAANLLRGISMQAAAGSYALTGVAAGSVRTRALVAGAGSYVLTGNAAGLAIGARLAAQAGAYAITGNDAGGLLGLNMQAAAGSYVLTGNAAGMRAGRVVAAASGVYTLTGNDAAMRLTRALQAQAGSYVLTGVAAGLTLGRSLAASVGSYVLTGKDATLTYAASAGFSIGTPVDYWAIAQAIRTRIVDQLGVRCEVEAQFTFSDVWVGVFREARTAPEDWQRLDAGHSTRFRLEHRISCWAYAPQAADAAALRNTLVGDVEVALMIDRTLGGLCEAGWIDGGRFVTMADPNRPGIFWGGAEIDFIVVTSAYTTP